MSPPSSRVAGGSSATARPSSCGNSPCAPNGPASADSSSALDCATARTSSGRRPATAPAPRGPGRCPRPAPVGQRAAPRRAPAAKARSTPPARRPGGQLLHRVEASFDVGEVEQGAAANWPACARRVASRCGPAPRGASPCGLPSRSVRTSSRLARVTSSRAKVSPSASRRRAGDVGAVGPLRLRQVAQRRAGRRRGQRRALQPEAVERCHLEVGPQEGRGPRRVRSRPALAWRGAPTGGACRGSPAPRPGHPRPEAVRGATPRTATPATGPSPRLRPRGRPRWRRRGGRPPSGPRRRPPPRANWARRPPGRPRRAPCPASRCASPRGGPGRVCAGLLHLVADGHLEACSSSFATWRRAAW